MLFDELKKRYSQGRNFVLNSPKLNFVDRAGSGINRAGRELSIIQNPNSRIGQGFDRLAQTKPVRLGSQFGTGAAKATSEILGIVDRINQNPYIKATNRFQPSGLAAPLISKSKQSLDRFVASQPQAKTTGEKIARFGGEMAPYVATPALRIPKAVTALAPGRRIIGSSLIRGGEMAGISAGLKYGEGQDVRKIAREIPQEIALGGVGNAVLSPKLTVQAIKYQKIANKMDRPIPKRYSEIRQGDTVGKLYKPDVRTETLSNAQFEQKLTGSKVPINYMKEKGTVTAKYDKKTGELISWSSDNPQFAKRIQEGKIPFGLSTREVKPSEGNVLKLGQDISRYGALAQKDALKGKTIPIKVRGFGGDKNIEVKLKTIGDVAPENVKDITGFDASFKSVYRNFEKAFGSKFQDVKRRLLDPFDASKGTMIDEQVTLTNNLKEKVIKGLGINRKSKESALVQQFGEGRLKLEELKKQTPKWKEVVEADKFFRAEYDRLLNELNSVRSSIYPNNPDKIIPKRQDYYRHFQELEGIEGIKNIFEGVSNIPTELAGISDLSKPKSKWLSLAQKRLGGKFEDDAVGGFLDYVRASTYAKHIDPHIAKFRGLSAEMRKQFAGSKTGSRFVEYIDDFANDLSGKTNPLDRGIQKFTGRKFFQGLDWLNKRVKLNVILGNISSAVAQAGNMPQMMSKAGYRNYSMGIKDAIAGINKPNKTIDTSPFIKERYTNAFSQFDTGTMANTKKFAGWITRALDEATTKAGWHAFYRQAQQKGVKNPVKYADNLVRDMVAGRGIGEVPLIQKSKVFQMVAPFQVEVQNLWHVLGKQVGEKKFGELIKFAVAAYGFNKAAEAIRGNGVTFDPIEAVADAIATYKDEDDKKIGAIRASGRLLGEGLSNVAFGQTVASLYPEYGMKIPGTDENITRKELFGREDPTRFGSGLIASRGIQDPFYKVLPPFGGQQIKRTKEGIQSFARGFSESAKGLVRFPIEKNAINALKTATLGEYSTKEAREYFNKERNVLGEKQSELFKSGAVSYDKIMSEREQNKELDKLKAGKKSKAEDLGGGLFQIGDKFYSKELDKEFRSREKADEAITGKKFVDSGKALEVIGDQVFRANDTERGYSVTTKIKYDQDVMETKKTRLKKNEDIKGWIENAEKLYANYEEQLKDPKLDELEKMKIEGKMDDLLAEAKKYQGYGGFTKGKTAKKAKKMGKITGLKLNTKVSAPKLSLGTKPSVKVPGTSLRTVSLKLKKPQGGKVGTGRIKTLRTRKMGV
jgi:hypothetical protein